MEHKITKITALLMTLCFSMLVFSGCGNTKMSTGNVPTLVWYLYCSPQQNELEIENEVNRLLEGRLAAKVDLRFVDPGSYKDKMNMIISSGESFDLCFSSTSTTAYVQSAKKGAFMQLKDLIDKYGKGIKDLIPKKILKGAEINGELYAIPNYQMSFTQYIVATYKSLADKYNFDMSTIHKNEDIEPYLKVIKENEPALTPFRLNFGPLTFTTDDVEQVLITYINKKTTDYKLTSNEGKKLECAKLFMDWYHKGYIRSDINAVLNDTAEAQAGRYAFFTGAYKPGVEEELKNNYGADCVYAIISDEPYSTFQQIHSAMTSIGKQSKNPELAMQLINIVNTVPEIYNTLCYGIEGKNYTKLEDGRIRVIDNSGYNPGRDWVFGCQFNAYITEGNSPDLWEKTKKLNEEALVSPLQGFAVNTELILTELTSIGSVNNEYKALFNGSISPSDFDKIYNDYLHKLNLAGYQKAIDEIQRQIDEWRKTSN